MRNISNSKVNTDKRICGTFLLLLTYWHANDSLNGPWTGSGTVKIHILHIVFKERKL